MLTMKELLLISISEECGEIAQNVSKYMRFGRDSQHCEKPDNGTNAEELMKEFYQLQALIEHGQKCGVLPVMPDKFCDLVRTSKIKSFEGWAKVSRKRGLVE